MYTIDEYLKAAEIGEVSMIDARHVVSLLEEARVEINKQSGDEETASLNIGVVMPRYSEEQIKDIAYKWSCERSTGNAEQDSECMYDFAQGMRTMQVLLFNEA